MNRYNFKLMIILISLFIFMIGIIFSATNFKTGCKKYRGICYEEWAIVNKVCKIKVINKGIECYVISNKCNNKNYDCYLRKYVTQERQCPSENCINDISIFILITCTIFFSLFLILFAYHIINGTKINHIIN